MSRWEKFDHPNPLPPTELQYQNGQNCECYPIAYISFVCLVVGAEVRAVGVLPQADHHDKAPYKISTQYLKVFRSYRIVKVSYQSGCWVDHQYKPPYKISTQYPKAFRSYPIMKFSYRSGCRVGG